MVTDQVLSASELAMAADRLARPGLGSDDGADLVVACLVGELDFAESLQERRHVHPETTAIALAEAVPAAEVVDPTWQNSVGGSPISSDHMV